MELRQLQYAIKIAEERSFSKAADLLHLAQPSLSQQIIKLEKELGVRLFERETSPLRLTYAGERFLDTSHKIIDLIEQLKKEMEDVAALGGGMLTLGSLPITGAHIMPLVLPVFKEKYPGIEIRLMEETTKNLEQLTARGATDMSILTLPIQENNLEWDEILQEEICLAVPRNHPLSQQEEVNLSSLHDEPFILLKKGQGFRYLSVKWCEEAGFVPRVVFESTNIETVQSLVAAGMGIAFVPHMVTRHRNSEFLPVYIRLTEPRPFRTLVMAHRKGRYQSKASLAFLEIMKKVLQSY